MWQKWENYVKIKPEFASLTIFFHNILINRIENRN